jgi:hypothetical protein
MSGVQEERQVLNTGDWIHSMMKMLIGLQSGIL